MNLDEKLASIPTNGMCPVVRIEKDKIIVGPPTEILEDQAVVYYRNLKGEFMSVKVDFTQLADDNVVLKANGKQIVMLACAPMENVGMIKAVNRNAVVIDKLLNSTSDEDEV